MWEDIELPNTCSLSRAMVAALLQSCRRAYVRCNAETTCPEATLPLHHASEDGYNCDVLGRE
jgi:hypothetical protein